MITKTLPDVIEEVLHDPSFMSGILADPVTCLNEKGWELSLDDQNKLQELVRARREADKFAGKIIDIFIRTDTAWLPPAWSPSFPYSKLLEWHWPFRWPFDPDVR